MKKTLLTLLLLPGFAAIAQQNAQFNQYLFNAVYINPAYSGYKESPYLHSFYRSQWTGMEGAPRTMSFSVDGSINDGDVGLSLIVTNDQVGAQEQTTVSASYSYRLRVGYYGDSRLSFGIGIGALQAGIDGTKLRAAETEALESENSILPDARAGVFYSGKRIFAGFSMDNMIAGFLAKPDHPSAIPVQKPHLYLNAGALLKISDMLQFKPSFLLKDDTSGPTSLDLNAAALINKKMWLGAFYRSSVRLYEKKSLQKGLKSGNAVGLHTEFFAITNMRIGYSLDYSLARTVQYSSGSHEISVGFFLGGGKFQTARRGLLEDFPY